MNQKKSKNNIQDVDLSAKMWMHNMQYHCLLTDNQYFSMFSLSKVSKLHFHTQFKSQNIQILNNKRLINTF